MPRRRTKRHAQRGEGWFSDAVDAVKSFASPINDFLKRTQLVSKGANLVGDVTGSNLAKKIGSTASSFGYGRRGRGRVHHHKAKF